MVNGVSLRPSVGVAQPFLDKINSQDTAYQPQDGISGEVEYIDSEEIVFAFRMPKGFKGTPTIHLVGPGRAAYLNRLPNVRVNSHPIGTRLDGADWMFGSRPRTGFGIKDFKVFSTPVAGQLRGLVSGDRFAAGITVYVNGVMVPAGSTNLLSPEQISIQFPDPQDERLEITLAQADGAGVQDTDSKLFSNLSPFTIHRIVAVNYEEDVMVVKVEGIGLNGLRVTSLSGADLAGATVTLNGVSQAFIRLVDPEEIVGIELTNARGQVVRTVVVRPRVQRKQNE